MMKEGAAHHEDDGHEVPQFERTQEEQRQTTIRSR
jgi:hypothetical protein